MKVNSDLFEYVLPDFSFILSHLSHLIHNQLIMNIWKLFEYYCLYSKTCIRVHWFPNVDFFHSDTNKHMLWWVRYKFYLLSLETCEKNRSLHLKGQVEGITRAWNRPPSVHLENLGRSGGVFSPSVWLWYGEGWSLCPVPTRKLLPASKEEAIVRTVGMGRNRWIRIYLGHTSSRLGPWTWKRSRREGSVEDKPWISACALEGCCVDFLSRGHWQRI